MIRRTKPKMQPTPLNIDLLKGAEALMVSMENDQPLIWDPTRKKNVSLKPEELVRQLLIQYLGAHCHVGIGRMIAEKQIPQSAGRRFDLGVMGKDGRYLLLAECKSFKVKLDNTALNQIVTYNTMLEADYLLVTNGHITYAWRSQPDLEFLTSESIFQALF